MKMQMAAGVMLCGMLFQVDAQTVDPKLMTEVTAVRQEVARSLAQLNNYKWIEHTEVYIKGDLKSKKDMECMYDEKGVVSKSPIVNGKKQKPEEDANALSNRPLVRKKADTEDYIERAVSMIHSYVPPKPDQMNFMLTNNYAYLGKSAGGQSEIRFKKYLVEGDSVVYTYDAKTKVLKQIGILSNLGNAKDKVTMEAAFQQLPDGTNHMATMVLKAPAKKIEIRTTNSSYQKLGS
ncbi:MAG: hypothetical protein HY821_02445 [Acidobacteria bacterium]|nr:hypothetical protein [Acidobacteriota bacterium]